MSRLLCLQAVQISSPHHRMAEHGDAWQILMLAVGVALVGYGAVPALRLRQWRAHAFSAPGRIVDHVPGSAGWRRGVWLPVVQFEADGITVRVRDQHARSPHRRPVGEPVEVLYDRGDPHRARLAGPGAVLPWAFVMGVAVVGLFAVIVTI